MYCVGIGPGHDDRGTAPGLVGPGISDPDRGVDDPRPRGDSREAPVDPARRFVARAGALAREQDRHAYPRLQRTNAFAQAADEVGDRPRLRERRIVVRGHAMRCREIERADESARHVPVRIHRRGDEGMRPDRLANG